MTSFSTQGSALVRVNGALKAFSELSGAEIAAALTTDQRAKISAAITTPPPSSKAKSRVQIVAHAVENDPACKGKAELALAMLADDEYAPITGAGIVKLLQRAPKPGTAEMSSALNEIAKRHAHHDPNAGGLTNGRGVWAKVLNGA